MRKCFMSNYIYAKLLCFYKAARFSPFLYNCRFALSLYLKNLIFQNLSPNYKLDSKTKRFDDEHVVLALFILYFVLLFPVNCETTVFLGGLSVTVLSITKDIFVYLVITIRCKRRVKNCKFLFDILTVKWF